MTTQEFKKVGRLLKEVYAELEREAIADGVDIFSPEFIEVRDALRLKVLERMGFTLEEYREAKELVAPAKKVDVAEKLNELSGKAGELEESVQNLHIPDEGELLQKMQQLAQNYVKPPVIQNNIVERTTKVVEKPTVINTTVKETVNEEFDANPIYAEIGYLNDKIDSLEIPEPFDPKELLDEIRSEFAERLEENINMLGMPDFRKLAMGLQAQIEELRSTPGGATAWGSITGTLSAQTDLQSALDGKSATSHNHTGVYEPANANLLETTDIGVSVAAQGHDHTGVYAPALGLDDNYVTDAEKIVIGNTSGTNTGDNAVNSNYSSLVSNATHTGDATGSTALTVVKIQGKDFPTLSAADDQKYPKYNDGTGAFVMTAIAGGGDMVLADTQSVTGLKTFDTTKLAVKGSSTGTTAIASANAGASNYTATLPAKDGTVAMTSDITGTNSGTNTGDQTITLSGDISGTGTGAITTTIGSGKVTEAMQVLADNTTNDFSTSKHGYVPKGTNTGNYLKDDGTWAAVSVSGLPVVLSADVGTTSSAAYTAVFTIPLTANSYHFVSARLIAYTNTAGVAVQVGVRVSNAGTTGQAQIMTPTTATASPLDNLALSTTVATNGETAVLANAKAYPIMIEAAMGTGATPGNFIIEIKAETGTNQIYARKGSYYILTTGT